MTEPPCNPPCQIRIDGDLTTCLLCGLSWRKDALNPPVCRPPEPRAIPRPYNPFKPRPSPQASDTPLDAICAVLAHRYGGEPAAHVGVASDLCDALAKVPPSDRMLIEAGYAIGLLQKRNPQAHPGEQFRAMWSAALLAIQKTPMIF